MGKRQLQRCGPGRKKPSKRDSQKEGGSSNLSNTAQRKPEVEQEISRRERPGKSTRQREKGDQDRTVS